MLIDLHAHQPLKPLLHQHNTWGPFWEFDEAGNFFLRVGKWILRLSTKEHKAAVAAGTAKKQTAEEFFDEYMTPQVKVKAMDARGVDKLVISVPSHWYMYWTEPDFGNRFASMVNDNLAEFCSAYPDRLYYWGHAALQDPKGAVAEIERSHKMGARGLSAGGANFGGLEFDSKELYPVWEKLCELDVPIFVHGYNQSVAWGDRADTERHEITSAVGMLHDESSCFWNLVCGGVLDDFPELKVYITHGGGYVPYQIGRFEGINDVLVGSGNKKPMGEYLKNFWFDPMIHALPMRQAVVDVIGADHLLYGDNFGGSDGIREDLTEGLRISEEDRQKIRWKNAAKLLRIDVPAEAATA